MGKDYYDYINVGSWDNGGLKIDDDEIWPNTDSIIKSVCSEPCDKGQIKVRHLIQTTLILFRPNKGTHTCVHTRIVNVVPSR